MDISSLYEKIITPIINAFFLIPLLALSMGSIEFIAQTFDLLPVYIDVFRVPYLFLTVSIIIIFGIPLFWLANRLMKVLERLKSPTTYDHVRQSIFYYFVSGYILFTWIFSGFMGNVDDVYFLTGLIISIISILSNYYLLIRSGNAAAT